MIKTYLKLAIRNVGRNKRRSVITMITVLLGTVVVLQVRGLINGLQAELIRNLTRKVNGDIQVHVPGYKDHAAADPYDYMLSFDHKHRHKLSQWPNVRALTTRVKVPALINNQRTQKTTPTLLIGIEPEGESLVCPRILDAIPFGRFLRAEHATGRKPEIDKQNEVFADATELDDEEEDKANDASTPSNNSGYKVEVMLSKSLVGTLQAELGDELVILVKDEASMDQAIIGQLVGTIDYNLPFASARIAWLDGNYLPNRLGTGDRVSEIVIRLADESKLEEVKSSLTEHYANQNLLVETWGEVAGFFTDVMALQDAAFKVVLIIMFIIVSSAIINTSIMSVSERTQEIGTLMALGFERRMILWIFLLEALVIGLLGGLSGTLLGLVILALERIKGLPFTLPGTATSFTIFPTVNLAFIFLVIAISVLSAFFAALYPSLKASKLKPVDALRNML